MCGKRLGAENGSEKVFPGKETLIELDLKCTSGSLGRECACRLAWMCAGANVLWWSGVCISPGLDVCRG